MNSPKNYLGNRIQGKDPIKPNRSHTGAVVKAISDVDTSRASDFADLPSGWATASGAGLHRTSVAEVDELGRTAKSTDALGHVTCTVYDDAAHEMRFYAGWDSATNAPTGPTVVVREDRASGYVETLTMTATPDLDGSGRPTGAEAISGVRSLSRTRVNDALTTSRISTVRGRPPDFASGNNGRTTPHCSSVRSDKYGFRIASPFRGSKST